MLKIEYVDITTLKEYDKNAKIHTTEQIDQIVKSIDQFGFNDPIAITGDVIVEGHGRLYAAQKMGTKEVPIIRLDHLSDKQRKMYTLVHNKLTMNTDFDLELLDFELLDLSDDFNIGDFGFEFDEDEDFSDKNAEINTDDYADEMELKFKLSYSEYELANEKLKEIASTPENALKILLKMEL